MTRLDYQRIAAVIHDIDLSRYDNEEYTQRTYIAIAMAAALAGHDNFDRGRFIAACLPVFKANHTFCSEGDGGARSCWHTDRKGLYDCHLGINQHTSVDLPWLERFL